MARGEKADNSEEFDPPAPGAHPKKCPVQGDSLSCCPVGEDTADLESVSTPSSNNSANGANQLTQAMERDSTKGSQTPHLSQAALSPQLLSPSLFVSWSQVRKLARNCRRAQGL